MGKALSRKGEMIPQRKRRIIKAKWEKAIWEKAKWEKAKWEKANRDVPIQAKVNPRVLIDF